MPQPPAHLLNPDDARTLVSAPPADVFKRALSRQVVPVAEWVLLRPADRERFLRSESQAQAAGMRDFEFSTSFHDCRPDAVFDRLRWGGQLFFVSKKPAEIAELLDFYRDKPEWQIEHDGETVARPCLLWLHRKHYLPRSIHRRLFEKRTHFGSVRKVLLDPVSRLTARHSYDVRLVRARGRVDQQYATDGWVVLKRVPSMAQAIERLRQTCPDVPPDRLGEIAAKLVRKVFPIFLTREAAFLKLLQRDLPPELKVKTPRVLSMETDDHGLVRGMSMRWLRQGGPTLSQTEFAKQSAELLRALHERVGIMHLDLRLDNMLITENGVGMVDFGSSVRVGEDLADNPMLERLVKEMLQASQITRDLTRMRKKKLIRGEIFEGLPFPPTPAFDLFALATNMTRPHDNADFKGLVEHTKTSDEGQRFSHLRRSILKPKKDEARTIRTAHDLCEELGVTSSRPEALEPEIRLKPVILTGPSMPRQGRATPQPGPDAAPAKRDAEAGAGAA